MKKETYYLCNQKYIGRAEIERNGNTMAQLSEKELSCINESLSEEELLVKKYQMLARQSQDNEVSAKMEEIAQRHQKHFNQIYSLLG